MVKDTVGVIGLVVMALGVGMISVPWAMTATGGVLIFWATIEEIRSDR